MAINELIFLGVATLSGKAYVDACGSDIVYKFPEKIYVAPAKDPAWQKRAKKIKIFKKERE